MDHFSLARAKMQIYSYLLAICAGGLKKIWIVQGYLAGDKKNFTMPSLGRPWL